jgi:Tol biopolymer transport system component
MGEVYQARDTRLKRDVAIKVLPAAFARDVERMARLRREAQTLAALNHPNIAAVYELEECDAIPCVVMELVAGDLLSERLARQPLQIGEVLGIATQIIEALEAAHGKGIIHRDLKPSNIKITPDGKVKVLDFGLAKPVIAAEDSSPLTLGETGQGAILGTPAYMSPEQARGRPVDKRTDIWAFGCILFELLTRQPAFAGNTASDTIAGILERDPDWKSLPARTPSSVRRLLARCLRKDSKSRLHDIADARIEIEDAEQASGAVTTADHQRKGWPAWVVVAAVPAAVVVTWMATTWISPRETASRLEPVRFSFEPPAGVTSRRAGGGDLALSPDGRRVAFVGQDVSGGSAIWLRFLDSEESHKVQGSDGGSAPFWSPDGQFLGFFAQNKLKKVAIAGGTPENICTSDPGLGATWNSSGDIVFNPTNRAALMRVAASGGAPEPLTTLDPKRNENSHRWPSFLPDGRHFLFTARSNDTENTAVYIGSIDSKETKRLITTQSNAIYSSAGYLLFARDGTLMAQGFDAGKLELEGVPFPIVANIDQEKPSAFAFFSVAKNENVIAFHEAATSLQELTWFDRSGKAARIVGEKGLYGQPRLSPDGKHLAVVISDPENGNRDIWIMDPVTGIRTQFTSNPANDWFPVWSPDGKYLAFSSDRGSKPSILRKSFPNGTNEELLVATDNGALANDWSYDGRYILFSGFRAQNMNLSTVSETRQAELVVANAFSGSYSANGKWLAYETIEGGRREIYVRSIDGSEKHRISPGGGLHPRWKGDSGELYYLTPDGGMMAADVDPSGRFNLSPPTLLFHICNAWRSDNLGADYEILPDGQQFLFSCQAPETRKRTTTVAIQWLDMIKTSAR